MSNVSRAKTQSHRSTADDRPTTRGRGGIPNLWGRGGGGGSGHGYSRDDKPPPPPLSLSFYISSGFQLFPIPKFERIVSACFIYLRIARLCLLFLYLLLPTHIFIDVTYVRLTNWSKSISCWNLPACLPVLPQSIVLHCKQSRRWRRPPPCLKLRCIWNFGVSWAFLIIIITHAPSSSGGQLLVLARSLV